MGITKEELEEKVRNREDLSGFDLSKGFYSGLNLAGAKLSGANLSESDFVNTNFSGADLSEANFSLSNLSGAILENAKIKEAKFSEANLRYFQTNNIPFFLETGKIYYHENNPYAIIKMEELS